MADYSKAVIYTIRTDDGLYVGSTCYFKERKRAHKSNIYNENDHHYNYKLYKNIRANDGEYHIELYKPFPCNSKRELEQEETKLMMEMNANLNEKKSYRSEEEKKEYNKKNNKEYREKNKDERKTYMKLFYEKNKDKISARQCEIVICECGCKSTRQNITRHRTSKKHLKLMEELDDLQSPVKYSE